MSTDELCLTADIRAAIAGDQRAWQRLFDTFRPAMLKWSQSFSQDSELSEDDLVQEAWLSVCNGIGQFYGSDKAADMSAMFYSWLRTTARSAMISQWRRRNANRRIPDNRKTNGQYLLADPNTRTASSIVAGHEEFSRMRQAIHGLPDAVDRQIMCMVVEDGLSLRTVASVLKLEYTAIRRRFHRVLGYLATQLNSHS